MYALGLAYESKLRKQKKKTKNPQYNGKYGKLVSQQPHGMRSQNYKSQPGT